MRGISILYLASALAETAIQSPRQQVVEEGDEQGRSFSDFADKISEFPSWAYQQGVQHRSSIINGINSIVDTIKNDEVIHKIESRLDNITAEVTIKWDNITAEITAIKQKMDNKHLNIHRGREGVDYSTDDESESSDSSGTITNAPYNTVRHYPETILGKALRKSNKIRQN